MSEPDWPPSKARTIRGGSSFSPPKKIAFGLAII
jgi:hypothetical protein